MWVSQGELNFRQTPTFEDCFPASEKCYRTVLYDGLVLRVEPFLHNLVYLDRGCESRQPRQLAS